MHRRMAYICLAWISAASCLAVLPGCGKSEKQTVAADDADGDSTTAAKADARRAETDPAADREAAASVVRNFLQAIKSGDETVSNDLLTPLARQKTSELDMAVAPIGSETASFTVGEVELPAESEGELAHVASTWTDVDDDGAEHTDEILWVLRREETGWRIGGMATKIFEDQPPLLLDFEDPVDMRRKQQLAEAEMERRARQAAESQTGGGADGNAEPASVPVADQRQSTSRPPATRKK